ncbi:MAG: hypothetical protein R6X34_21620 [Chloroflexota bacterium]
MLSMSKRMLYMFLGAGVTLALLAVLVIGGTAVFAQSDDNADATPVPAQEEQIPGSRFGGMRGHRGGHGAAWGDQGAYLAEALGITAEELEAAQTAVRTAQMETAVAQALADGLITQEQADAILAGEGQPFGMRGFGMERNGRLDQSDHKELLVAELGITVEELEAAQATAREAALAQALADGLITQEQIDMMAAAQALRDYIDHDAILAEALGVSAGEVTAAKDAGTLRDLIQASGLTAEEIGAALQTAHETALAQAVADGVITQEQADSLQTMPGSGGLGGMRGGGHGGNMPDGGMRGGGHHGGGFPGVPFSDDAQDTPDTSAPADSNTNTSGSNA